MKYKFNKAKIGIIFVLIVSVVSINLLYFNAVPTVTIPTPNKTFGELMPESVNFWNELLVKYAGTSTNPEAALNQIWKTQWASQIDSNVSRDMQAWTFDYVVKNGVQPDRVSTAIKKEITYSFYHTLFQASFLADLRSDIKNIPEFMVVFHRELVAAGYDAVIINSPGSLNYDSTDPTLVEIQPTRSGGNESNQFTGVIKAALENYGVKIVLNPEDVILAAAESGKVLGGVLEASEKTANIHPEVLFSVNPKDLNSESGRTITHELVIHGKVASDILDGKFNGRAGSSFIPALPSSLATVFVKEFAAYPASAFEEGRATIENLRGEFSALIKGKSTDASVFLGYADRITFLSYSYAKVLTSMESELGKGTNGLGDLVVGPNQRGLVPEKSLSVFLPDVGEIIIGDTPVGSSNEFIKNAIKDFIAVGMAHVNNDVRTVTNLVIRADHENLIKSTDTEKFLLKQIGAAEELFGVDSTKNFDPRSNPGETPFEAGTRVYAERLNSQGRTNLIVEHIEYSNYRSEVKTLLPNNVSKFTNEQIIGSDGKPLANDKLAFFSDRISGLSPNEVRTSEVVQMPSAPEIRQARVSVAKSAVKVINGASVGVVTAGIDLGDACSDSVDACKVAAINQAVGFTLLLPIAILLPQTAAVLGVTLFIFTIDNTGASLGKIVAKLQGYRVPEGYDDPDSEFNRNLLAPLKANAQKPYSQDPQDRLLISSGNPDADPDVLDYQPGVKNGTGLGGVSGTIPTTTSPPPQQPQPTVAETPIIDYLPTDTSAGRDVTRFRSEAEFLAYAKAIMTDLNSVEDGLNQLNLIESTRPLTPAENAKYAFLMLTWDLLSTRSKTISLALQGNALQKLRVSVANELAMSDEITSGAPLVSIPILDVTTNTINSTLNGLTELSTSFLSLPPSLLGNNSLLQEAIGTLNHQRFSIDGMRDQYGFLNAMPQVQFLLSNAENSGLGASATHATATLSLEQTRKLTSMINKIEPESLYKFTDIDGNKIIKVKLPRELGGMYINLNITE